MALLSSVVVAAPHQHQHQHQHSFHLHARWRWQRLGAKRLAQHVLCPGQQGGHLDIPGWNIIWSKQKVKTAASTEPEKWGNVAQEFKCQ